MTSISDEQLLELNKRGFIPGPDESEKAFLGRVSHCLEFSNHLDDFLSQHNSPIPFKKAESIPNTHKKKIWQHTQKLYDIAPNWVPAFYSNAKLLPWHGGSTWVAELEEKPKHPIVLLQLNKKLSSSPYYLGIYNRSELLKHEISHVGRMTFLENRYEELLAYRSSKHSARRFFGPIIESPKEVLFFVVSLILLFSIDLFLLAFNASDWYDSLMWLKAIPCLQVFYLSLRLIKKHRKFNRCLRILENTAREKGFADAVAYRLTDVEIEAFSRMNPHSIKRYAKHQSLTSLRWRLILKAYFPEEA